MLSRSVQGKTTAPKTTRVLISELKQSLQQSVRADEAEVFGNSRRMDLDGALSVDCTTSIVRNAWQVPAKAQRSLA